MIESISQFLMTAGVSAKGGQGFDSAQNGPGSDDIFARLMQDAQSDEPTGEQSMALMGALMVALPTGLNELTNTATAVTQDKGTGGPLNLPAMPVGAQMLFGNGMVSAAAAKPVAADAKLLPLNTATSSMASTVEGELVDPELMSKADTARHLEIAKSLDSRSQPLGEAAQKGQQLLGQAAQQGQQLFEEAAQKSAGGAVEKPGIEVSTRSYQPHSARLAAGSEANAESLRYSATSLEPVTAQNESGFELLSARSDGMAAASSPGPPTGPLSSQGTAQQPLQAQLQAAVGSEQWAEELRGQLVRVAVNGDQQVALHLNPRELGPLMVELKMVDNQAHLQFVSGHQNVRNAVEQAIPLLREMLSEQGIALGDSNVSQGSQQQQQQQESGRGRQIPGIQASHTIELVGPAPVNQSASEPDGKINIYI